MKFSMNVVSLEANPAAEARRKLYKVGSFPHIFRLDKYLASHSRQTFTGLHVKGPLFLSTKLNSVVLVRKRTIPTKRPQPAGEVSANFS
jgi:hypothetical protein